MDKPVVSYCNVEALIAYRGSISSIIESLGSGIQIAMGYVGAKSVKQLHQKAQFVFVTKASIRESQPHDLDIIVRN